MKKRIVSLFMALVMTLSLLPTAWAAELIRPAEEKDKFYVDLWEANRLQMIEGGVLPEHITVTDVCTACHSDVFHSYRKTKSPGRMAAILELV